MEINTVLVCNAVSLCSAKMHAYRLAFLLAKQLCKFLASLEVLTC